MAKEAIDTKAIAERTLNTVMDAGFDAAQVSFGISWQDELNIAQNEPSLLRSTEDYSLTLTGIVDSRKATTTLTDIEEGALAPVVSRLLETARQSPQDEANAVSAGQRAEFTQGPLTGDVSILTTKAQELLEWRAANTPRMNIEEGIAAYLAEREHTLTSEGSSLSAEIGCYHLSVFGSATDGTNTSSFNHAGGTAHDLTAAHACDQFGIGRMMTETQEQITTRPFDGNFVGDVILAPNAVSDLVRWLLRQIGDHALMADASLYKNKVGEVIAARELTLASNFEHPGGAPFTGDAFAAPAFTLVDKGRLTRVLPTWYGSRKTGIDHTPAASGWRILPGDVPLGELIAAVDKGAIVNRLSMGSPGPNGDFSGVIKNSFKIEGGKRGEALSETMISGNMAKMLREVSGISREHLDTGSEDFPWIRIPGLHFS